MAALNHDLALHPGHVRQSIHLVDVHPGDTGGDAEREPCRGAVRDVAGLGPRHPGEHVSGSRLGSSICTNEAAASAIAASTSGAIRLPPTRVSEPLALMIVRTPRFS